MATETPDGCLIFEDRVEAGRLLGVRLSIYQHDDPIILALPRGGVVVGYEVAHALNAPLDVVIARKLGVPGHEELAMGAIAPGSVCTLDNQTIQWAGITEKQIQAAITKETVEMNRRLHLYRGDRPLPEIRNRTAILVDDGLATGLTMQAAVQWIRHERPQRLIVAVPVGAPETCERLRREVDNLICLCMPPDFRAVGMWYRRFEQTTDQEVIDLLAHQDSRGE
jgi:putative phosphoribosyl transferase